MELSDQLLCLFSAHIEERDGAYTIEIPKRELQLGTVDEGETYRVALSATTADGPSEPTETESTTQPEPSHDPDPSRGDDFSGPPVSEGDTRRVEIADIGEQGDGVTRVERGYVVIVPDTEMGERVRIEITDVRENVAFAEVVERLSYYD